MLLPTNRSMRSSSIIWDTIASDKQSHPIVPNSSTRLLLSQTSLFSKWTSSILRQNTAPPNTQYWPSAGIEQIELCWTGVVIGWWWMCIDWGINAWKLEPRSILAIVWDNCRWIVKNFTERSIKITLPNLVEWYRFNDVIYFTTLMYGLHDCNFFILVVVEGIANSIIVRYDHRIQSCEHIFLFGR